VGIEAERLPFRTKKFHDRGEEKRFLSGNGTSPLEKRNAGLDGAGLASRLHKSRGKS